MSLSSAFQISASTFFAPGWVETVTAPGLRRSGVSPAASAPRGPAPGPRGPRPRPRTGGFRSRTARVRARSRTRRSGRRSRTPGSLRRRPRSGRPGGLAGLVGRGLDAVVYEVEGGPARPLAGVTLLVRHDEDRRVERRLLRPRLLAEVEHALAHHARAGALERLAHDVVLAPFLAALAELQVLLEEPLREYPLLQFHPLRHPALRIRVVHALLGRDEPVQRHRHAEEHLPGHQSSTRFRTISVT